MHPEYKAIYIPVNKRACLFENKYACSIDFMKYGERLKIARDYADLTQTQLADRVGNIVTQANISYLEKSDATGSEFTVQFASACGVAPIWLASETGDMVSCDFVVDPRLRHAMALLEPLPSYAIDHVIQEIVDTAKLVDTARHDPNPNGHPTEAKK